MKSSGFLSVARWGPLGLSAVLLAPKRAAGRSGPASLAAFHPALAQTWLAASSNKMLQPHHLPPNSRKLAWWCCPSCQHQFTKRIDLHVAAGGECPSCHAKPAVNPMRSTLKKDGIAHRCRPSSSQSTLAAENINLIRKSVADGSYLRVKETRNLMPMLAKSYEKEEQKISPDEIIYVSPKLDGIRCVAAYDAKVKQILFFSRAGTLFECCDAKIEPALRYAFERDPLLVLDGELYNDSANVAKLNKASQKDPTGLLKLLAEARRAGEASSSRTRSTASMMDGTIGFELLTSAIRTTRSRLTPEVAALQNQLQYHVFDLLYATDYPAVSRHPCFGERNSHLQKVLSETQAHNLKNIKSYDPNTIQLVSILPCLKQDVPGMLQAAMQVGYEGVMVRRDGLKGGHLTLDSSDTVASAGVTVRQARSRLQEVAAAPKGWTGALKGDTTGRYGYGQRSSTLLKYKVMQDAEFIILSAVEGKGKWKGSLGAFVCQARDRKNTFTVTPASTDAEKRVMWQTWKKHYRGKALTVQFQELTPEGIPRFPVGKCVRGAANGKDWI